MNFALIMAAGKGTRMNLNIPKQLIDINGKPLIIHTINKFLNNEIINKVFLVIQKEDEQIYRDLLSKEGINDKIGILFGGKTRQESVYLALSSLKNKILDDDIVLIHDGARPNISDRIIHSNIDFVKKYKSSITAYNSENTIIRCNEKNVEMLNRDELFVVQTPQSFFYKDILNAHEYCYQNKIEGLTDDSSIYIKYGLPVKLVNGSKYNLKITTSNDIDLYKFYLKNKIE